jgi:WD40 repeat protein
MSVSSVAPQSPYKGLAPFEDSDLDALLFFGRARETEVIAANLMAARVTVLYGPSGVGKTSVLRAGVAYRLHREENAHVVVFSSWPGDPVAGLVEAIGGSDASLVDALADAADRAGGDVFVILDQFEEYFLYHEHDSDFEDALAEVTARPGVRANILIGIREETLAQLDAFKAAVPTLLSNRLRLQRLDRESARAAIVGPVGRYNELVGEELAVELEPELIDSVLDEVVAGRVELSGVSRGVGVDHGDGGRIEAPYLQLVMARLWDVETARGSRTLRLSTLRELGGATQIVEDHLERAMAELSGREKDVAAAMYTFLVTPSGTKIAHDVRDLAGYADVEENEAANVLRRLSAERIVRSDSDNGTASRYEIYHDVLAEAVVAWRNRHDAERALHEAERRRRRAVEVAVAALVGLVLVAGIAIYALLERSHSQTDARRARAAALASEASIEMRLDPQKSLRSALAAARLYGGSAQERVLREALIASRLRAVRHVGKPIRVAGFSPDGRWFVSGDRGGKVHIYDARSLRPERTLDQQGPVSAAVFSPDAKIILTAGRDGSARLWRMADGQLLQRFPAAGAVRSAFLARRGFMAVTVTEGGKVRVWSTRSRRLLRAFSTRGVPFPKLAAVDPSGTLLVVAGHDRHASAYSLANGRRKYLLEQKGFMRSIAFRRDGRRVLTAGYEGRARIWDARSGQLVREFRGPDRAALAEAVFSADGAHVSAAGNDGTVRVWETETGQPIGIAVGHAYQVTHVAFNRSGTLVVSGSSDGTAKVWSREGRLNSLLSGRGGAVTAVAFSPDGNTVLTASDDGNLRIWNPFTDPQLKVVARVRHPTSLYVADGKDVIVKNRSPSIVVFGVKPRGLRPPVLLRGGTVPKSTVAISPDRRLEARGARDGEVSLVDAHTRKVVRTWPAHTAAVTSVAFSPDGKKLVTASLDKDVRIWAVPSGKLLHGPLRWHFGPVASATFSPDGRWILTAGPSSAGLGFADSGDRLVFLRGHTAPLVGAVFAGRDGRLIVTAAKDGTIRSWRCGLCGDVDDLIALAARRIAAY